MPLPNYSDHDQQRSIRSFFKPPKAKSPQYVPPPAQVTLAATVGAESDAKVAELPPPPPARQCSESQPKSARISHSPPPPPPLVTYTTNPSLPREAGIRSIELSDITALRRLNSLLLPVAFPDSFYQAVLDPSISNLYSRIITWDGDGNGLPQEPKIIGAIVCIPEFGVHSASRHVHSHNEVEHEAMPTNLYIRSLGILAPYRSLGLAAAALDDILATAYKSPAVNLLTVTAHVWTENEQGLQWYLRRGFERIGEPIQGYYRKLRPDSAILVSRPVHAAVFHALAVQNDTSNIVAPPRQIAPSPTAAIINRPPLSTTSSFSSDARPPPRLGGSYQNQRSDMEWNDLPTDMMTSPLPLPRRNLTGGSEPSSGAVSGASSRSSSRVAQKKKKDRSYPAAAFGS